MPKKDNQREADNSRRKGGTDSQENLPPTKHKKLTSFFIELVLDEGGQTKRTKVMRVEDALVMQAKMGIEDKWDGWQDQRLLDFIIKHSGLRPPAAESGMPTATTAKEQREPKLTPDAVAAPATTTGSIPTSDQSAEPGPTAIGKVASTSRPSLQEFEIIPVDPKTPSWALQAGQQFEVRLILDFNELEHLRKTDLNYKATLYAKNLRSHQRQLVKEEPGFLKPTEKAMINIGGLQLKEGSYQLQITARLTPQSEARREPMLLFGEKLLEVY